MWCFEQCWSEASEFCYSALATHYFKGQERRNICQFRSKSLVPVALIRDDLEFTPLTPIHCRNWRRFPSSESHCKWAHQKATQSSTSQESAPVEDTAGQCTSELEGALLELVHYVTTFNSSSSYPHRMRSNQATVDTRGSVRPERSVTVGKSAIRTVTVDPRMVQASFICQPWTSSILGYLGLSENELNVGTAQHSPRNPYSDCRVWENHPHPHVMTPECKKNGMVQTGYLKNSCMIQT